MSIILSASLLAFFIFGAVITRRDSSACSLFVILTFFRGLDHLTMLVDVSSSWHFLIHYTFAAMTHLFISWVLIYRIKLIDYTKLRHSYKLTSYEFNISNINQHLATMYILVVAEGVIVNAFDLNTNFIWLVSIVVSFVIQFYEVFLCTLIIKGSLKWSRSGEPLKSIHEQLLERYNSK